MLNDAVTIIIVSYNSKEILGHCLDELLAAPPCSIIVVDNASTDSSAEYVAQHYPRVKLFKESINHGYGGAANIGLRNTQTPYALLLNPDMKASKSDVERLIETAEQLGDRCAILAPAVNEQDFTKQGVEKHPWVIGAALLFNMSALKECGGLFDENIFLYYEETDLGQRLLSKGYYIYLNSDHYIEHLFGQSSGPSLKIEKLKNWHLGWSSAYYHHKHKLNFGKNSSWRTLTRYFKRSLISKSPRKRIAYKARLAGLIAFLRGEQAFNANGRPKDPYPDETS